MKPFLKAFLFCDGAVPDPGGTLTVRGVWQQLRAPGFPATHQVQVFVAWSNLSAPRYEMTLRVTTPGAPGPFDAVLPIETRGQGELDWMSTAALELGFDQEGEILFEIFLDGEPYGGCVLPVRGPE